MDDLVSEIFSQVQALGLLENTVFIITTDHGEEFRDHGGKGHGDLYVENCSLNER